MTIYVSSLKSSHALSCAQIWCAAGVNLSGGRLPGDAAAASSDEKAKSADPSPEGTDDASSTVEDDPVEKLDKELSEGRRLVREAELVNVTRREVCEGHFVEVELWRFWSLENGEKEEQLTDTILVQDITSQPNLFINGREPWIQAVVVTR